MEVHQLFLTLLSFMLLLSDATASGSDVKERLTMMSVVQESDSCFGDPKVLDQSRKCFLDCPRRRSHPDQHLLLDDIIRIHKKCASDTSHNTKSEREQAGPLDEGGLHAQEIDYDYEWANCSGGESEEKECFKDLPYAPGSEQYTISLVYLTGTKRDQLRRRLLQWDNVTLEVVHDDNNLTVILTLQKTGMELIYGTVPVSTQSVIHLLITFPDQEPEAAEQAPNPVVRVNGMDVKVTNSSQITEKRENEWIPPYTIRLGSNTTLGNINPFIGDILMLDLFKRQLSQREAEAEYQYVSQPNINRYNWHSYEFDCICPFNTTMSKDNRCSDGKSHRYWLNGNGSNQYFFPPDAVNSKTILNGQFKNTGVWMATKGWPLHIILDRPAVLRSMTILAHQQYVRAALVDHEGNEWTLFCIGEQNHECQDRLSKPLGSAVWKNITGQEAYSELSWQTSESEDMVAYKIFIWFNKTTDPKPQLDPEENPVYSVMLHGRYLNRNTRPGECICFPGNSVKASCDECGQCLCRTGQPSNGLINKQCRPFISSIEPNYGPVSGGTEITLVGGLLQPYSSYFNNTLNNTSVVHIGDHHSCNVTFSNDTHIVCTTEAMSHNHSITHLPQDVRVKIVVGGIYYQIPSSHHFTYLPDPIIRDVHPYETIIHGGILVTVSGKHMDSVYIRDTDPTLTLHLVDPDRGRIAREQRYGRCLVHNAKYMICSIPEINLPPLYHDGLDNRVKREITTHYLEADVGLILDGVEKYRNLTASVHNLGRLKIYKDPKFDMFEPYQKKFQPYLGENFLSISGKGMTGGCQKDDYNIWLLNGHCREECPLVHLYSNEVRCQPPQELSAICETYEVEVVVQVGGLKTIVGSVKYEYSELDDPVFRMALMVGIISSLLLFLLVGFAIWYYKRRQKQKLAKRKEMELKYLHLNRSDYQALIAQEPDSPDPFLDLLSPGLKQMIKNTLINESELTIVEEIGQGNFGKVYQGTLYKGEKEQLVAAKTLRDENVTNRQLEEFLEEATIMKDFHHRNVLSLLGVIIRKGRAYVTLPYMAHGDLKNYVTTKPYNFISFTGFACDVAKGMDYLAKQKFIHRDLAARNCMVDGRERVLVADFGLARDIYEKDYYRLEDKQRPLPAKWMALESLQGQVFSTKSDVWSFGVLMWEIYTKGRKPYADVNNFYLREYLQSGLRLEKPTECPDLVYGLMSKCWLAKPEKRPTFDELVTKLEMIMENFSGRTRRIDTDSDYDDQTSSMFTKNIQPHNETDILRGEPGRKMDLARVQSIPNEYITAPYDKTPISYGYGNGEKSGEFLEEYFIPVNPHLKERNQDEMNKEGLGEIPRTLDNTDYCEPIPVKGASTDGPIKDYLAPVSDHQYVNQRFHDSNDMTSDSGPHYVNDTSTVGPTEPYYNVDLRPLDGYNRPSNPTQDLMTSTPDTVTSDDGRYINIQL